MTRPCHNILLALSLSHFINDMLQSLLFSIYPILKASFSLNFAQIGLITLAYQLTSSLLQPVVGVMTDKRPLPYLLPFGMVLMLAGLVLLSQAGSFPVILSSSFLIGTASSIFHPEASRITRAASGNKHGFAQSFFQTGGNAGTACGPLVAAYLVVPCGQASLCWFCLDAVLAVGFLLFISRWYKIHHLHAGRGAVMHIHKNTVSKARILVSVIILLVLVLSKYFYLASINNYYSFYLINKFHVSVHNAQLCLFVFLGAVALGTLAGWPLGNYIGRKHIIWMSLLGALPFTIMLPHADLFYTIVLSFLIGIIIASAFSAILVFAQELIPGKPGMIAGMFFGFAFGMAGIGAMVLGRIADATSVEYVYKLCAWLPLTGLLTVFLPEIEVLDAEEIK